MARNPLMRSGGRGIADRPVARDPLFSLYRDMTRLFDDMLHSGFEAGAMPTEIAWVPRMNVSESESEIRISVELPSVSEKDVDVVVEDHTITIRGEKKLERTDDKEDQHLVERAFGGFQRTLKLPFTVSPDDVRAKFDSGVLYVTVTKKEDQKSGQRIAIEWGSGQSGEAPKSAGNA